MDSIELGRRLRVAREARGLTQQAVAAAIEVPRTALSLVESGERAVSTLELSRLAKLYRRPVSSFFEEAVSAEEDALVTLHRIAPGLEKDPEIRDQVDHCLDLCRDGVVLEALLGRPPRLGPPAYDMRPPSGVGEAVSQGGQVAHGERRRLGIGNFPIPDVSGLIGTQGIWASGLALPAHMSGLFMRHPSIGLAIIVNASHPRGRKRFSYAHEYAHALMDRNHDVDVTVSSTANSKDLVETRANAFAASFLMPRNGMYEVLRSLGKGFPSRQKHMIFDVAGGGRIEAAARSAPRSQRITYEDVAHVAHHFGVSYQAAVFRLNSLRHVSRPESNALLEREDFGRRYLEELSMFDDVGGQEKRQYWDRELRGEIARLAIEAYRREEISRGRLLELSRSLGIPGATFLELAEVAREG